MSAPARAKGAVLDLPLLPGHNRREPAGAEDSPAAAGTPGARMSNGNLPARKAVKQALQTLGMSNRQIKALLADGWRGLVTESEAEASELRDRLDELSSLLHVNGR